MMQIAQILCTLFVASCARRYEGDHALLNTKKALTRLIANETVGHVAGEIVPCTPRR